MNFIAVGTNHKHSALALREKLHFSRKRLRDALVLLKERNALNGAVILSTCNRTEIYASAKDPKAGIEEIVNFISRYHELDKLDFLPYFYIYEGEKAVAHLFSVSCGMDSLIVGERQVLEQVLFSRDEAEYVDFADDFLKDIFISAVSLAERIHSEIDISGEKISLGSAAVDFVKEKLRAPLKDRTVLIIGMGKVTEILLANLKKEASDVVFIANRTFEKAKELAGEIGASAVRFGELKHFLKKADVVITATASPHYVIKKETIEPPLARRLIILDLAVPRDVDPRVGEIDGIGLFNLEDLDSIVQKAISERKEEIKKADDAIAIETRKTWARLIRLEPERALSL